MAINRCRPRKLLALFAAAVLTAGLLVLAEANPARAVEPNFAPTQNYPVGSSPVSVTTAHFNDDGEVDFVDFVVSNHNTNTVSILLGNGDGTLQAKQDFEVGTGPRSGTSADFDEDGNADLALAVGSPFSNIAVLLGNGDGTFQAKRNFAVGSGPTSVASADFNADGNVDLAASNSGTHNVSVLLGNGDGSFQAAMNYSVSVAGSSPHRIITADFNADGKMDLATANIGSDLARFPGGVAVLLGKGDGTFQDARKVLDHFFNNSVTAADFNGDGKMDLAATGHGCCGTGEVSVVLGNGDGTFQAARRFRVGSGHTIPTSITSEDFDSDNKADLAVSNSATDNVSVFAGNGDGSFQTSKDFPAGDNPASVTGADFNANGFVDLAVPNQNSNNVSVLLNTTPPPPDTTNPITTRSLSPQPNAAGWNNSDLTVTLSATDNPGGSGVKEITYSATGAQPIASTTVGDRSASVTITIEGETSISYFATDNAGNQESPAKTLTVKLDKSAPDASITSGPNGPINDSTPTFSFGGSDNLTAANSLLVSYKVVADGVAPDSVNWSEYSSSQSATLGDATGLAQDTYTFYVRAKDQAGNEDASPAQRSFTVDTTVPVLPTIDSPANNSYDTDGTITLSGTAEANSIVKAFEGTTSKGTTQANSSGAWSKTLSGVANGSHTYTAKATDAAGNTSAASSQHTVIVDTNAPGGAVFINGGATYTKSATVSLTLSASDASPGSGVAEMRFSEDGTTWSEWEPFAASKPWVVSEGDGEKTVYVQYKDAAGNQSDTGRDTIILDKTDPDAPIISSPAEGARLNVHSLTLSGTVEEGAKVELFEGGVSKGEATAGSDGAWSIVLSGVSDGSHSYTAKASDAAGNASAESDARTVIVDATKPTVGSTTPLNRATGVGRGTSLTATFSEKMKASTINVTTFKVFRVNPDRSTTQITNVVVTVSSDGLTATLDPFGTTATVLTKDTKYKAVVTVGAKDVAGNALDQNLATSGNQPKAWSFTTRG